MGITHSDYTTIQGAIDAATNGTTIIIRNGSYNELITINKTIHLRGEDRNTTFINFNPKSEISQVPIITINADNCSIENLQITLSKQSVIAQGISVNSKHNTIKNDIITGVADGIDLSTNSEFNTVIHNTIKNNLIGINGINSKHNSISNNILLNIQYNIYLSLSSDNNTVFFNVMNNSDYALRIKGSEFNKVYTNCIKNNHYVGLYCCCGAQSNYFYNNSLINNTKNAEENMNLFNFWYDPLTHTGNYWDDYNGKDINQDGIGDTAYVIDSAGNYDMYPLMTPPLNAPCNQ